MSWTPAPPPTARDLFTDNLRRHVPASAHASSMLVQPRTMLRPMRGAWPMLRVDMVSQREAFRRCRSCDLRPLISGFHWLQIDKRSPRLTPGRSVINSTRNPIQGVDREQDLDFLRHH